MQTVLIIGCLSLGAFVRGAVGFADALVAMPLLLLLVPLEFATAQMALASLLIAFLILQDGWQEVEWKVAFALIVPGLLCVPLGVFLTKISDPNIGRILLGSLLTAFATWSLLKPSMLQLKSDKLAPLFGSAAGILSGAFNIGGPPLVFYSALRRWPPNRFRATMQVYAVFGSIWLICVHAAAGNMTKPVLLTFLLAIPCMIAAVWLGKKSTSNLPADRFVKTTHTLLVALGLLMIATAVSA